MTRIERRIEVPDQREPDYIAVEMDSDAIAAGRHRKFVGGRWDEIGEHQQRFLISRGLTPSMTLLDVGCGSLRAGRHFVDHLDDGHYFGIDINATLIEAGYDHELTDAQRAKLPVENLRATDRFDADFGVEFDMAIANSVFTHTSLNYVRLCLHRLASVMRSGGEFYATFFEQPDDVPLDGVFGTHPRRRFHERDIYWYYASDMTWAAERLPFDATYLGDWGHPKDQRMMLYTRR